MTANRGVTGQTYRPPGLIDRERSAADFFSRTWRFMKRVCSFVIALVLCLPGLLPGVSVFGQQQLTKDQQHWLKAWRDQGNEGEPPDFRKKFNKPEGKRLVENSWVVTFTYDVTDEALEKTAIGLAGKYGMKIRHQGLLKGSFARVGLFTGPESAARKLAEDAKVRTVAQDQYVEVHERPGPLNQPIPENKQLKVRPPQPKKRKPVTELWDESSHDAIGAPERPEYRIEDVVSPEELEAYRRQNDQDNALSVPEQGGRTPAGWWLDRLDVHVRSYDNIYRSRASGAGVDVYVLDSGLVYHDQFQEPLTTTQRVIYYRDAFNDGLVASTSHGTAVASMAGGKTLGTANGVDLVSVRITKPGVSVPEATWLQYFNDIRTRAATKAKNSVLNISFVIKSYPSSFTGALANVMADNILVVGPTDYVQTGSSSPRSSYFPGQSAVLLVGMTTNRDRRFHFTNFTSGTACHLSLGCIVIPDHGSGSDIFAPGGPEFNSDNATLNSFGPTVASAISQTSYDKAWGTSFAAPLVAGVAASFIAYNNVNYKMKLGTIKDAIIKNSTMGEVIGSGGNDRLLYSYFGMSAVRHSASYSTRLAPSTFGTGFNAFETGAVASRILDPDTGLTYSLTLIVNTAGQINFRSPTGIPAGAHSVEYLDSGANIVGYGAVRIASVAPGLFSLDASGQGIANAQFLLVDKTTFAQSYVAFSTGGNSWNPATHDAYMILYGSGWRGHNGTNAVQIKKGSTIWDTASNFPLYYIGDVPGDPALDQITLGPMPSYLLGQGECEIKVYVNGVPGSGNEVEANTVTVKFN